MTAKYKVSAPGYKTAYFQSFMGAYERAIKMLHEDARWHDPQEPLRRLMIWERTDGAWRADRVNTTEALREAWGAASMLEAQP